MAGSDAQSTAIGSPRSCASSSCLRIICVRMPRRRWLACTPTRVTPAIGSSPPGTRMRMSYVPAVPTGTSPSSAQYWCAGSSCDVNISWSCSFAVSRKAVITASTNRGRSSALGEVISMVDVAATPGSLDALERRVLEHQPTLGAVLREAHGHDAARLDAEDDALAERPVADAVAGRELRQVGLGHERLGTVGRPRGR